MAHPLWWSRKWFLYAIGNTSAVDLVQFLPPEVPAHVLLLGCGDPRNILHTLHTSGADKNDREYDFTCCDLEPAILARNVLILTMIIDGVHSDVIWDIYFHMRLDETAISALVSQCEKLIKHAEDLATWRNSPYGSVIRFSTAYTLAEVHRLWACYRQTDLYSDEGVQMFESQRLAAKASHTGTFNLTAMRSAGPFFVESAKIVSKHYERYWEIGISAATEESSHLPPYINPSFAFSSSGTGEWPLHYGSDPALPFHLALAFAPIKDNMPNSQPGLGTLASAIRREFDQWCVSFASLVQNRSSHIKIRFALGEALHFAQALSHQRLTGIGRSGQYVSQWSATELHLDENEYDVDSAPTLFNVVETSNLMDHLGPLNILISCAPLLSKRPYSALFTEALLASSDEARTGFATRLLTSLPVLCLFFGLAPTSFVGNYITQSNIHEIHAQTISDNRQFHERFAWKWTPSGDATLGAQLDSTIEQPISFDPSQFADVVFEIYQHMFKSESPSELLRSASSLKKINELSLAHYTRPTLTSFLKLIRPRILTDWELAIEKFLEKVMGDRNLIVGMNNYQELLCFLHMQGLYTVNTLRSEWENPYVSAPSKTRFKNWADVPTVTCVCLLVPRAKLKVLENVDANLVGTPFLQAEIFDESSHSSYTDLRASFGHLGTSESGEHGLILEDTGGWYGNADLIVSFWISSWTLMHNPEALRIRFALRSSPLASRLMSTLGAHLEIFSTSISDTKHVYVFRDRPNAPGELIRLLLPQSKFPDSQPETELHPPVVNLTLDSKSGLHNVSLISRKLDIHNDRAKEHLISGGAVVAEQISPCSMRVTIGPFSSKIPFPYPVDGTRHKVRIARKSLYIEVVVPLSGYQLTSGYSLTQTSVIFTDEAPVSWNIHYLNLNRLPILDIGRLAKHGITLNGHISCMFSDRERAIRDKQDEAGNASAKIIVDIKDSIWSILTYSFGLQTQKKQVFGLSDPVGGGVYTIIFVQDIRLDLASHTVVADAFVLPLTHQGMNEYMEHLASLNEHLVSVKTLGDEVIAWKNILPALVERCRTWKHKPTCEYVKTGKIPLSVEVGDMPICSCGRGIGTEEFVKKKGWKPFKKYVTRVAISPLFAVSYMEKVGHVDGLKGAQTQRDKQQTEANQKKRATTTKSSVHIRQEAHLPSRFEELSTDDAAPGKIKCAGCGKDKGTGGANLLMCGGCKKVSYCSQDCQKQDWKTHKKACRV